MYAQSMSTECEFCGAAVADGVIGPRDRRRGPQTNLRNPSRRTSPCLFVIPA